MNSVRELVASIEADNGLRESVRRFARAEARAIECLRLWLRELEVAHDHDHEGCCDLSGMRANINARVEMLHRIERAIAQTRVG